MPSIYASQAYLAAAAKAEPKSTPELAVYTSGDAVCAHPYLKRSLPLETPGWDIISAYDFGGFWFNSPDPDRQASCLQAFTREFDKYCFENGILTEFIRFCPFSHIPANDYYQVQRVENNVVVDLTIPYEQIWAQYPSSLRRNIRKARSSGLVFTEDVDLDVFLDLYYDTLDRLGSRASYYFPGSFLSELPGIEIFSVRDGNNEICASQLYLTDGGTVFYFLGASASTALDKRPNDFLFDQMIRLLGKRGQTRLHLGGGAASLLRFKKKFSRATVPYYIGKKIFNPEGYDALNARLASKLHSKSENIEKFNPTDFFPKYRYKDQL